MHWVKHNLVMKALVFAVLLLLALTGCAEEGGPYSVWVRLTKCSAGTDASSFACAASQGAAAGVIEYKLYPAQRLVVAHVVEQDPLNFSMETYVIENCTIFNGENWSCWYAAKVAGNTAYSQNWVVSNGRFTYAFTTGANDKIDSYVGTIHDGRSGRIWRWVTAHR